MKIRIACAAVGFLSFALSLAGQTSGVSSASVQVPPLIQFSGVATDEGGNTMSGVVSITFSLYSSQQGGEPLWAETQKNVELDLTGHYSVQMGITKANGVPTTLFTTGEARWMGIRIAEQTEQPRVLLLSVPYAMKAGDAATIGGLPPSAFMLAAPGMGSAASATTFIGSTAASTDTPASGDVTGTGTANFIPLWTTTSNIANSVLFQSGTGATAKIGVNNTAPATTLDVKGAGTIRGILNLPATGVATTAAGKNSQPLNLAASSFNSTSSTALNQTFQWLAEPASNDTTAPSGTLNLLFGEGATKPSETGLHITSNGQITFATGQTFPGTGTGNGTVTSVASGAGLTGGPIMSTGTLSIDTTVVPQLAAANTFTGNQTVNGNLSTTGTVTGSSFQIGSNLFDYGSYANQNAFLGFAGNSTMTGIRNTAAGVLALSSNTTGGVNTAIGYNALLSNTAGNSNVAVGWAANLGTTTGTGNVAVGASSLPFNTIGSSNTAIGEAAGQTPGGVSLTGTRNTALGADTLFGTGTLSNATAVGADAEVTESNAMVLGSGVMVGIGTTAPAFSLDVHGTGNFTGAVAFGSPITFASGQTFPGTGTITGVTAGTDLTGGGTSGTITLNLNTAATNALYAQLATANTFTGNQTVNGNVSATGFVTGGGFGGNTISAITSALNNAVYGNNTATSGSGANGGFFTTSSPEGTGVVGVNTGTGGNDYAGFFQGNVFITGSLSKGSGSFQIDHPLDPANKFLYHSFVESPDMMNIYNGVATLDARGSVWITLPDYFEALNQDFRYQLTSMGRPQPSLYVAREISGNRFRISGGKSGGKVSWQVTGVRHDAYADAHRIQVEVEKPPQEQGRYLHPELFGAPAEQAIGYPAQAALAHTESARVLSPKAPPAQPQ